MNMKQSKFTWLPNALLLVVCLLVLFFKLDAYPHLWFDEGYKLNAAYTLAHDGLYATYTTNGYIPFDPGTSGGPADIVPTSLALKLLGTTIVAARLSSVLYTLLAAISFYQLGQYLWGRTVGLFCVLLVIAMPPISQVSFILMGRQSLSEAAALSLMLSGLWILSRAWQEQSFKWSVFSGAVMGLGMLSKTQLAIGLVPALFVVASWRWFVDRKGLRYLFTPVVMIVIVFLGWTVIGQLLTPADVQQQNSVLFMDAIKTNIFTTLFGRNLDGEAFSVICIMFVGILTAGFRLSRTKTFANEQWIELILVLFTLCMMIWFAVFSIGWVRYAFAGMVVGLFLFGRFVWGLFAGILAKLPVSNGVLVGVVAIVAIALNFLVTSKGAVAPDVQNAAEYIKTTIPDDAIIETWEWELDMLSGHRQYHHPQQALLFEAIRQNSNQQRFTLTYDALQTNPDYLVVGRFGGWTGIYDEVLLTKSFNEVAAFGVYHIYKRVR